MFEKNDAYIACLVARLRRVRTETHSGKRRSHRGSRAVLLVAFVLVAAQTFASERGVQEEAVSKSTPSVLPAKPRLVVRTGHSNGVTSVAFSPDGRTVLTGSHDQTARLWDVTTGAELRCFEGHSESINAVAYFPNGRAVVTTGYDDTVRVWDIATGAEVRRFSNPPSDCQDLSVSPSGRIAVAGKESVQIWDIRSGAEVRRVPLAGAFRVALSPDGRLVVFAVGQKVAHLWNVDTGVELQRFSGHVGGVSSVAFSPDGQYVVTGDAGKAIYVGQNRGWLSKGARLWNVATGAGVRSFVAEVKSNPLGVSALAFSPDGRTLITGCRVDRTIRLWDTSTGKQTRSFIAHEKGDVVAAAFSPEGSSVLTAGWNYGHARLLDADTGTLLRRFKGAGVDLDTMMSCSRDGRFILMDAFRRNVARLWDTATGGIVAQFGNPAVENSSVVVSPDGRFVLLCISDGTVRVIDRTSGTELRQLKGHAKEITSIEVSPDGRWLLTASRDETARLWDLDTGSELHRLKSPSFNRKTKFLHAVFSPDGRFILTFGETTDLWSTQTGDRILQWQPNSVLGFTPDGRAIVHKGYTGELRLPDSSTVVEIQRLPMDKFMSRAYSPDGRLLALGDFENGVRLFDAATGSEFRRFVGHSAHVLSIAFISDGRFLVTLAQDSTTRLWEVATGRELCRLYSFENGNWVVVDPEGRFDTNDLEQATSLHWVLPDEPFTPLPLELFMRDYYEPGLLARIVAGEQLQPVRQLAEINPLRPAVRILDAHREADAPDHVTVRVEVKGTTGQVRLGDTTTVRNSGAYDVRLFRDGQIVANAPRARDGSVSGGDELDAWRRDTRIELDPTTGSAIVTFRGVPLPRTAGVTRGEFSAYAFNEDRIKSATDFRAFAVPDELTPIQGKVYVVTIGVNANQNSRLNLRFAASDARRIKAALLGTLQKGTQYGEVVSISLISDHAKGSDEEASATKANIKAVVDLLAGRPVPAAVREGIPKADRIQRVRPEDLVILSFSGHGYADKRGDFYLVPHDVGDGPPVELLARCVSSEEMSLWLRDVDAGEMVLIVDACHSAAMVEREGFKPGPMGSRGLGQLAYDKGMRILAATQVDNAALESERVQQGLLTYALEREGIGARAADFKPKDGKITLAEWLSYAVERVPALYEEIRLGKQRDIVHGDLAPADGKRPELKVQRPALFDFSKGRREVVLAQ